MLKTFLLCFFIVPTFLSAQNEIVVSNTGSWKVMDNLFIECVKLNCNPEIGFDSESILIKIKNKNPFSIKLTYTLELFYDGFCKTCDSLDEYTFELELDSFEEIEGNCNGSFSGLEIFSKFLNAANAPSDELSAWRIINLKVVKL